MKALVLALGLAAVLTLAVPRPAAADFSLSIGLPGFGLFVADPYYAPPVVAYAPPVVAYAPPVYAYPYAPVYRPYYPRYYRAHYRPYYRGYGRGHYRHGWR